MIRNFMAMLLVVPTMAACGAPGAAAMSDEISTTAGLKDSYTWNERSVVNNTTNLTWQRQKTDGMVNHADATSYCTAAGMRVPTRDELVALGNWAHANEKDANQAFPAGQLWQGFWSSTDAGDAKAWGVDFTGVVPDSVGIPVVACALPVTSPTRYGICVK